MQIDEQDLGRIAVDVFQSMLGQKLVPIIWDFENGRPIPGSVAIRGCQKLEVDIHAADELMASIADVTFDSDRGKLSPDDFRDVCGEISQLIAEKVLGWIGQEGAHVNPSFGQNTNWSGDLSDNCLKMAFECRGYPLIIVLLEFSPNSVAV
jgi:hypothetical protein